MARAVGQVEDAVGHQPRAAARVDLAKPRSQPGDRAVGGEAQTDHRRPEELDCGLQGRCVENVRAGIVRGLLLAVLRACEGAPLGRLQPDDLAADVHDSLAALFAQPVVA